MAPIAQTTIFNTKNRRNVRRTTLRNKITCVYSKSHRLIVQSYPVPILHVKNVQVLKFDNKVLLVTGNRQEVLDIQTCADS